MVIQVVNFNLEGIGHQDYLGATVDVAPAFKALNGLISKVWLSVSSPDTSLWIGRSSIGCHLL